MSNRRAKAAPQPRRLAKTAGDLRALLAELPDDAPIVPQWEPGKLRAMKDWDPGVDLFGLEKGEEKGHPALIARVGLFFLDDDERVDLVVSFTPTIRAKNLKKLEDALDAALNGIGWVQGGGQSAMVSEIEIEVRANAKEQAKQLIAKTLTNLGVKESAFTTVESSQ